MRRVRSLLPYWGIDGSYRIDLPAPIARVKTTCAYCGVGCQFDLNVIDDRQSGYLEPGCPGERDASVCEGALRI